MTPLRKLVLAILSAVVLALGAYVASLSESDPPPLVPVSVPVPAPDAPEATGDGSGPALAPASPTVTAPVDASPTHPEVL
jgi:hypothetical protein